MITTKNVSYLNATQLIKALSSKQISAVELLEQCIARIEKYDAKINAIPVRDFARAREEAKKADSLIAKGISKPLLGLPITVKESFSVAGIPTSWGNKEYQNWMPQEDALVVKRLKEAGAIIIGKSNVPFMLRDWQTYNDLHGTTNNPWDVTRTPGGSSGGSAAALAAGFVSLELGSDLAGSLRTPAHFAGIVCHRPSQDIVPLRGSAPPTMPASPARIDLAVAGPMARSVADLQLALDVIAGPDELSDGKGYKLILPKARHTQLKNFRVLLLDTHPLCPTEKVIQKSLHELSDKLGQLGVTMIQDKQQINLEKITKTFATFLGAFESLGMSPENYIDVKKAVDELQKDNDSLEANVRRGIAATHRDWLQAMQVRNALRSEIKKLFDDVDIIICPAMPTVAFPHDHSKGEERKIIIDGVPIPYEYQYCWVSIASLFGLPATVIPISKTPSGLPIGVQIIGAYLEDLTTLEFAKLIESEVVERFNYPEI